MLSEPKYKHNVMTKNGDWVGGSNDWDIARAIIRAFREKASVEGPIVAVRIITFH